MANIRCTVSIKTHHTHRIPQLKVKHNGKKKEIIALLEAGETPTAIAKQCNVTPSYVGRVRKETQTTIEWLEDELKATFKIIKKNVETGATVNSESIASLTMLATLIRELHYDKTHPRRPHMGEDTDGKPKSDGTDGAGTSLAQRFKSFWT